MQVCDYLTDHADESHLLWFGFFSSFETQMLCKQVQLPCLLQENADMQNRRQHSYSGTILTTDTLRTTLLENNDYVSQLAYEDTVQEQVDMVLCHLCLLCRMDLSKC